MRNAVGCGIAKSWGNHSAIADIIIDIRGDKITSATFAVVAGLWNDINRKAGTDQPFMCLLRRAVERVIRIGTGW